MATILVIIAKNLISVFRLIVFLEKRNQIPIVAKISKIDKNEKDNVRLVVMCSATESVRWSWVVKNGFIALRYRNVGNPTIPELVIPTPDKIIEQGEFETFENKRFSEADLKDSLDKDKSETNNDELY